MHANRKACISDSDEKLYVLDVFIDSVSLYAEKLYKISPNEVGVDLQFTDMPLFRMFQSDLLLTKPDRSKEMTREAGMITVYFNVGKVYLFTRNPSNLVDHMRAQPILLDVYKIKAIQICPEGVIKDPLGYSKIPVPGCLCDHVMMADNDKYHLPKSYEIKNTYSLVDEEYKSSGFISLVFRLTCFGTYIINNHAIVGNKLLFTNVGSFNEFLCTKVPFVDEESRRAAEEGDKFCSPDKEREKSELDLPPGPTNVAGLIFVCRDLCKRDGYPTNISHPNYPPKVPSVIVEEIPFDAERSRRTGFEQVVEEKSDIIKSTIPGSHRACMHIGCTGNVCTGQK